MIDWTKFNIFLSIIFLSMQIVLIVCMIDEFVNELKERFDERDIKCIISNMNVLVFDCQEEVVVAVPRLSLGKVGSCMLCSTLCLFKKLEKRM